MLKEFRDFLLRGNVVELFVFVVRPRDAIMARVRKPAEEGISDEERRHRELLSALRARGLTRSAFATATAGAFRDVPRRRRGSERGIPLPRNPACEQMRERRHQELLAALRARG